MDKYCSARQSLDKKLSPAFCLPDAALRRSHLYSPEEEKKVEAKPFKSEKSESSEGVGRQATLETTEERDIFQSEEELNKLLDDFFATDITNSEPSNEVSAEVKAEAKVQQNYFKQLHRNHRLNAYFLTLRNRLLAILDSGLITKEQRPSWTQDLNTTA